MKTTCISLIAIALVFASGCKKEKAPDRDDSDSVDRLVAPERASSDGEKASSDDEVPTKVEVIDNTERLAVDAGGDDRIDESLLAYVPDDSPFLLAALRPLPSGFVEYLHGGIAPLVSLVELGMGMAEQEADPLTRALIQELEGKLSRAGLREMGIEMTPRFVMYAIGWSVAMRVELADGKRFDQVIERIEDRSGQAMKKASFGDIRYRTLDSDDMEATLVLAIIDDHLVGGLMHANARDHVLPVLFGVQKPARSLADTGTVRTMMDEYKLVGMGMSYFDTNAATRLLTGQATGLSQRVMDASKVDLPALSSACRAEFTHMASAVPRVVFGYQSASRAGYDGVISVEIRADIISKLALLQSESGDLAKLIAGRPLAALGVALNIDRTKAWLLETVTERHKHPYQCNYLSDLNDELPEVIDVLQESLPPFVKGAHGLALLVKNVEFNGYSPTGEGFVAVGLKDPLALFEVARKELPALTSVKLQQGKTVAVPVQLPGVSSVNVHVGANWLGAAVGQSMAEVMTSFAKRENKPGSPFFTMAYDYKRLMQLSQQFGSLGSPEDMMIANFMSNLMGYNSMSLSFASNGILARVHTRAR